jgi:enoyl-CoA hydratase/carnithine racemase
VSRDHVRLEREADFAVLTLARPERRNALAEVVIREILAALHEVAASDARGLIVAAEGPVFCAGHDFGDMDGRALPEMQRLLDACSEMMQRIQSLPQPVIAQVEGLATAAGCQLVASCDLAVGGRSARFAVPGGRGGWFCTTPGVALARAVGRKHALEMLLTGDPIDADTALAWGLLNRVVDDARVAEETRKLLARATRGSRLSKAIGKRAFHRQVDLDTRAAYDHAGEVMAAASQTEDAQEGLRAFLGKRKPRFVDR